MHQTQSPATRPALLAVATALALAAGALHAQAPDAGVRERALEARVAELERLVATLVAERQAPAAAPAAPVPATVPAIQTTPISTAGLPGTRFSYGGFIKMETVATNTSGGEIPDGSLARFLYQPAAIPVGAADEGTDLAMSAQFSRFWFSADSSLADGTALKGYLEFDLAGSALGSASATNTYGLTVRHAWASWGPWLAGQTWSNFQDPASLVDAVDLIGATDGTVFVRQPQLRYTRGAWSFAVENPETVYSPRLGNFTKLNSDDNRLPDLTARWTHKGDRGHVSVAALLRELRYQTTTGIDASATGVGVSITGRRVIDPANDLRAGLTVGRGISRYVGLAIGPDAILDAGNGLDAVDTRAGFLAWRHVFSPTLRGNVYASASVFDNAVGVAGAGATEKVGSLAANLVYSPNPKLDLGAEIRLGRRWLENGTEGDLARLHLHAKYSF